MDRRLRFALVAGAALVFGSSPAAIFAGNNLAGDPRDVRRDTDRGAVTVRVQRMGDIAYVGGGVRYEEQKALEGLSDEFNLKVTMADQQGKYTGSALIRIEDSTGRDVLVTRTEGPLFLAQLPAGTYHVYTVAAGQTFNRSVTVRDAGQQQIVLTWPTSPGEPARAGDAPVQPPVAAP